MHTTALASAAAARRPHFDAAPAVGAGRDAGRGRPIESSLALLQEALPGLTRRGVHAGDVLYQAGEPFRHLYVLHAGACKVVNFAADGREQVVGLHFKGDWLGFDGIATGRYAGEAVALDTGEVWCLRYDELLAACLHRSELLGVVHAAMSREIGRDREALLSLCTLSAEARVAEFLHKWAEALAERGLRTDQITLRMTRAEIGNHLGMTLETVSRCLSRLARAGLIAFLGKARRDIALPDVAGLARYVQAALPGAERLGCTVQ